jgi:chromatin remodeling complex protein RSC6
MRYLDCLPSRKRAHEGMAKPPKKAKRTPSAAFMKPVTPDDKLAKIVGDKPLPRTELTKKLWVYIRKNGLQDAKKRTLINADENLKAVFNGKKQASMFEMTKLVSGHVKK